MSHAGGSNKTGTGTANAPFRTSQFLESIYDELEFPRAIFYVPNAELAAATWSPLSGLSVAFSCNATVAAPSCISAACKGNETTVFF